MGGLILGAISVFVIERQFTKASAFAAAGAVLSFFGFMHGEAIGFGASPMVALSYLTVAGVLIACAKFSVPQSTSGSVRPHEPEPVAAE